MSIFLFLEIQDPPVVELLSSIKDIFSEKPKTSPLHITVRGPYKNVPDEKSLERLWSIIQGEGVLLSGIRSFEFKNKKYIYIQSQSKAIRKIWWKSDYPIFKYGFNPHITLYEGTLAKANKIESFLKNEKLEFFCHNISLRLYVSGQPDLFGDVYRELHYEKVSVQTFNVLTQPYRWEPGIIERARLLKNELNFI
ncbi:MAG: hypothetical protein SFU55_05285 [Methylophilus sp.]|nr:hypothetical protein [Methylophilus sp.]